MDIVISFEQLKEKLAIVSSYHFAARSLGNSELQKIRAHLARSNSDLVEPSGLISAVNFSYRDPITGKHIFYAHHSQSVTEALIAQELHLNKQYQWLLAEAYEIYEGFLVQMYTCAGFLDKSFWPPKEYGDIPLSELEKKDWDWYVERVDDKRGKPNSILARFREKLPTFASREKKNAIGVNLALSISLIMQLRHHIVHTAGRVKDREKFVDKVLSRVGLYQNGKPTLENREYVESFFFFAPPNSEIISLLDLPHPNSPLPVYAFTDVFGLFLDKLLASAHLITFALHQHCNRSDSLQ